MAENSLVDIRKKLDKHIKDTYLKKVQAPQGKAHPQSLDRDLVVVKRFGPRYPYGDG